MVWHNKPNITNYAFLPHIWKWYIYTYMFRGGFKNGERPLDDTKLAALGADPTCNKYRNIFLKRGSLGGPGRKSGVFWSGQGRKNGVSWSGPGQKMGLYRGKYPCWPNMGVPQGCSYSIIISIPLIMWATSWENLIIPYANNNNAD